MEDPQNRNHENTSPKPWLDANGAPLSLSAIRRISQSWSPKIWDAYLETMEKGQSEYLGNSQIEGWISDDKDDSSDICTDVPSPALKIAMAELPALQQAVMESLLFDRISERGVAALYGLTRWRVRAIKEQALTELRRRVVT